MRYSPALDDRPGAFIQHGLSPSVQSRSSAWVSMKQKSHLVRALELNGPEMPGMLGLFTSSRKIWPDTPLPLHWG